MLMKLQNLLMVADPKGIMKTKGTALRHMQYL